MKAEGFSQFRQALARRTFFQKMIFLTFRKRFKPLAFSLEYSPG